MLSEGLRESIARHSDAPAMLSEDGQTISYARMGDWITSFSARLAQLGVGKGHRVVPLVDNTALRICLWFAIWRRGGDVVMVERVESLIDADVEYDHVIAFADQPKIGDANWHVLDDSWRGLTVAPDDAPIAGNMVFGTSGSTGRPKFMSVSAEVWYAMVKMFNAAALEPAGHTLITFPTSSTGHFFSAMRTFDMGYGLTFWTGDAKATLSAAKDFGVTIFAGSPRELDRVVEAVDAGVDAPDFAFAAFTGGLLSPAALERAYKVLGAPISNTLGASECGAIAAGVYQGQDVAPGWTGKTMPHVTSELRGQGGYDDLAYGAGKLAVKVAQPLRVQGYFGGASPYDDDGWFETGDIVTLDADKTLHLIGREDFLINVSGTKYAPERLEAALSRAPEITKVAVAGLTIDGAAQVVALVVPLMAGTDISMRVTRVLEEALGRTGIVQCRMASSLPELPTGKIDRAAVVRLFQA